MYPELQQLARLAAAQAPGGGCAGQEQLFLPIIMFAIIYVVWLRPASQERKVHAEMLKNLKRGDKVVTTSGLLGTIADKSDATVTLEIAKGVKVEMLRSAVAKRMPTEAEVAAKKDAAEAAKKKT